MALPNFFPTIFPKQTDINLEWPKMAVLNFFQQFFPNRLVQIWNGQKWLSSIFSNNVPKKTAINWNGQKWLFQIFSDNFSQKDCYKFGMAKNGCSDFFPTIFPIKVWYKFKMAKNGHSKFFQQFLLKRLVQIWIGQKRLF